MLSAYLMTTFAAKSNKPHKKAAEYFTKLHTELDLEKYKLAKYEELIKLVSFQNMHDADLAYQNIYHKCAGNAHTKASLLSCLDQEEKFLIAHPSAFNADIYKQHIRNAISEIKTLLQSGAMDHLYN